MSAMLRLSVLVSVVSTAAGFVHTAPSQSPSRSPMRLSSVAADIDIAIVDVEPFEIVREDLKTMKLRIKALVERTLEADDSNGGGGASQSHPLLQGAAREFFERRERAFRPAIVLLMARALSGGEEELSSKQRLLAEIVEMMSTAQIIHDSVLEDGANSADGNVAHRMYVSASAGNKVSVLAGDFLLARSSVALSQLGDLHVVELMATALESMVCGGVLQAQSQTQDLLDRGMYQQRTRLKTSSLISDACRSAAVLAGYAEEGDVCAEAAYRYADELGLAYQTMADTIAYQAAGPDAKMVDHASSPPVILAAEASVELREAVLASDEATLLADIVTLVDKQGGVAKATKLALEHYENAVKALDDIPASRYRDALSKMALYAVQPDQRGLQRDKYIAAQQAALV